jgi:hypothetical protein
VEGFQLLRTSTRSRRPLNSRSRSCRRFVPSSGRGS